MAWASPNRAFVLILLGITVVIAIGVNLTPYFLPVPDGARVGLSGIVCARTEDNFCYYLLHRGVATWQLQSLTLIAAFLLGISASLVALNRRGAVYFVGPALLLLAASTALHNVLLIVRLADYGLLATPANEIPLIEEAVNGLLNPGNIIWLIYLAFVFLAVLWFRPESGTQAAASPR